MGTGYDAFDKWWRGYPFKEQNGVCMHGACLDAWRAALLAAPDPSVPHYGSLRTIGALHGERPAPPAEDPTITDSLDWERLMSGAVRALDPLHQPIFDRLNGAAERAAKGGEGGGDVV